MKEILPNVFLIRDDAQASSSPFTYLALRPEGNVLFATKADISPFYTAIEKKGGVSAVLIGDRHHVSQDTVKLSTHFNAPLIGSHIEAKILSAKGFAINAALPYEHHALGSDIQIIPTPGHTTGAFSYLWNNGVNNILFIGDTLVPVEQAWQYWVSPPSRKTLADTLNRLKAFEFDHIISNSFACQGGACRRISSAEKESLLNNTIKQLVSSH
ncbi:hypothetical protein IFT47_17790 [Pseudomonas sp. CFBP 13711]|uniref:hypothetical protein n=1 Tax=unclassified Pseudomonas TaxID=196821 RepID=UPI001783AAAF|nr:MULTISPECIES: hypothetical protein [unclassified Pseudomonas]MBD8708484.1 hypothetical protein [Pseudomonas sp. CFBP 13711]MBD8713926.1 hypothetical protein [Pseudomonas sp. CFBP 13715]